MKTIKPRLTCDGCGKRALHNVIPTEGIIPNSVRLVSSCCSTGKIMGEVQKSLVAQGLPVRASYKIERIYWNIWEPFSFMTPTEKGFVLSSIGVKIDYREAYNGKPVVLNARQKKIMRERYGFQG